MKVSCDVDDSARGAPATWKNPLLLEDQEILGWRPVGRKVFISPVFFGPLHCLGSVCGAYLPKIGIYGLFLRVIGKC